MVGVVAHAVWSVRVCIGSLAFETNERQPTAHQSTQEHRVKPLCPSRRRYFFSGLSAAEGGVGVSNDRGADVSLPAVCCFTYSGSGFPSNSMRSMCFNSAYLRLHHGKDNIANENQCEPQTSTLFAYTTDQTRHRFAVEQPHRPQQQASPTKLQQTSNPQLHTAQNLM